MSLELNGISLCIHIYFIFSICLSVDIHFNCFQLLGIMNCAAINIDVTRSLWFHLVWIYIKLCDCCIIWKPGFMLLKTLYIVSSMTIIISVFTNSMQRFLFIYILSSPCYLLSFLQWPFLLEWGVSHSVLICNSVVASDAEIFLYTCLSFVYLP